MRALATVVLGFCCASLVSCGPGSQSSGDGSGKPKEQGAASKPQDLIAGKWEMDDPKIGYKELMEFTLDGNLTTTITTKVETTKLENTYKFLDDQTLQLYEKGNPTAQYKVELSKTDLTLTNTKRNKADKYKRVP
jgi:hypothetical protein